MTHRKIEMTKIDRNERIRSQKMNSPTTQKSEFSKNETSCNVDRAVNRQPDFRPETSVSRMFAIKKIFKTFILIL